jgi:glycosyltransferase involved in cell wall biosynthesis
MQPLVSIVIPVYNGANFLRDAIESALAQTYPRREVIVVNDGSTDGGATEAVAKSFNDRIRYFSKPNGGVASALNHGIERMAGDYFSWLSHDDMYHPNKLELQVLALGRLDSCTVVYSDFEALDVASGAVRPIVLPDTPAERFRWFISVNNSLHGCTVLVPRACFRKCGLFNEQLRTTQDYDMWFRIAARFRFVHVPGVVVTARHHPGQETNLLRGLALQECDRLLANFVEQLGEEEVRGAPGESLARAYGAIASSMQARGFLAARDVAREIARKQLAGEPLAPANAARSELAARLRLGSSVQRLRNLGAAAARWSRRTLRAHADGTRRPR